MISPTIVAVALALLGSSVWAGTSITEDDISNAQDSLDEIDLPLTEEGEEIPLREQIGYFGLILTQAEGKDKYEIYYKEMELLESMYTYARDDKTRGFIDKLKSDLVRQIDAVKACEPQTSTGVPAQDHDGFSDKAPSTDMPPTPAPTMRDIMIDTCVEFLDEIKTLLSNELLPMGKIHTKHYQVKKICVPTITRCFGE